MAKDGTNRGGARPGAGAKKKPLADKLMEGNPGKRNITVINFENAAELEGQEMPRPSEMLSAVQKDGKPLQAAEIYKKAWEWLHERGCSSLISPQLLEMYSMSYARWMQCEEMVGQGAEKSIRGHGGGLQIPGEPDLDGDIPNRERELRQRVRW